MVLPQETSSSSNEHNANGTAASPLHPATIIITTPFSLETSKEISATSIEQPPLPTPSTTRPNTASWNSSPSNPNRRNNMVHREPESPTQSSRSPHRGDASSEESFIKHNLRCMLGSVSPSSNDDDFRNSSTGKSEERPDSEQLLQALQVLNELAAMNSSDYQAALLDKNYYLSKNPKIQSLLATNPQLVKLHQSIHRFHSQIRNLTAENDQQTEDLLDFQNTLETKNERMAQLEAAVSKLHKRNTKLKERTKSNQSKTRKLFQQVKEFTANATKRKKEEDFAKLAMQVQHHEQVMMNRERTESNFSDLDGLQDFLPETTSVASSADLDTVSSTHSSVYEDGVATLRISRERTATWPPVLRDAASEEDSALDATDSEQASPSSKQEGEQPKDVDALRRKSTTKHHHNPNPFAMLLAPRPAQPFTLQFLEPYELQFVALLVSSDKNEQDCKNAASNDTTKKEQTAENTTIAFAICGHHGFDSSLNVKPSLGARLLQMNKKDLDPTWTVQYLEQHIRELGSRATMTFRNETWTKSQKEALQMAIQEQERLHPESASAYPAAHIAMMNPFARKRGQSADNSAPSPSNKTPPKNNSNKNIWGFLNFQGSGGNAETNNTVGTPRSTQEESHEHGGATIETPGTQELSITRTNSRDSQSSRSPTDDATTALCPKEGNVSLAMPVEIATKPVTHKTMSEECFSFEEDEEPAPPLFLGDPTYQDARNLGAQSEEEKKTDAAEDDIPPDELETY